MINKISSARYSLDFDGHISPTKIDVKRVNALIYADRLSHCDGGVTNTYTVRAQTSG